jgi:hypothetical protein
MQLFCLKGSFAGQMQEKLIAQTNFGESGPLAQIAGKNIIGASLFCTVHNYS